LNSNYLPVLLLPEKKKSINIFVIEYKHILAFNFIYIQVNVHHHYDFPNLTHTHLIHATQPTHDPALVHNKIHIVTKTLHHINKIEEH